MENGRRPLYQQPHTKPALLGGNQQQGMLQGSQPMMWNQPQRQKPWYEQQPYGPAQFMVDTANKVAGVVSDPLFAIARGDLHRAAAGYVPGRQNDMDAGLARRSMDATGAVMAGSSFAQAPRGALRSFGAQNEGLEMSQEARLQRASDMGFDTDQVYYRGLGDEWKTPTDTQFFTQSPELASDYAIQSAGSKKNVVPAFLRGKMLEIDARGMDYNYVPVSKDTAAQLGSLNTRPWGRSMEENFRAVPEYSTLADHMRSSTEDIAQAARLSGYDGVRFQNLRDGVVENNDPATVMAVFNPSNIRSVNAAFDPAKRNSANLMASHPFAGAIPVTVNNEDKRRKRKGQ